MFDVLLIGYPIPLSLKHCLVFLVPSRFLVSAVQMLLEVCLALLRILHGQDQDTYLGKDVGVLAQEIEAVLPEVVTTRATGNKAVK